MIKRPTNSINNIQKVSKRPNLLKSAKEKLINRPKTQEKLPKKSESRPENIVNRLRN